MIQAGCIVCSIGQKRKKKGGDPIWVFVTPGLGATSSTRGLQTFGESIVVDVGEELLGYIPKEVVYG